MTWLNALRDARACWAGVAEGPQLGLTPGSALLDDGVVKAVSAGVGRIVARRVIGAAIEAGDKDWAGGAFFVNMPTSSICAGVVVFFTIITHTEKLRATDRQISTLMVPMTWAIGIYNNNGECAEKRAGSGGAWIGFESRTALA